MITIILIVLLILVLTSAGWRYRTAPFAYGDPLAIILLIVVVLLLLGLFGGPRLGYW